MVTRCLRLLARLAATGSLLLFAVCLYAWHETYSATERLRWLGNGHEGFVVDVSHGHVAGYGYASPLFEPGFSRESLRYAYPEDRVDFTAHGSTPDDFWAATISFRLLCGFLAAPPAIWLCIALARRKRCYPVGHCQECGYDIRGGGDRCSECGQPFQAGTATAPRGIELVLRWTRGLPLRLAARWTRWSRWQRVVAIATVLAMAGVPFAVCHVREVEKRITQARLDSLRPFCQRFRTALNRHRDEGFSIPRLVGVQPIGGWLLVPPRIYRATFLIPAEYNDANPVDPYTYDFEYDGQWRPVHCCAPPPVHRSKAELQDIAEFGAAPRQPDEREVVDTERAAAAEAQDNSKSAITLEP